jgi:hypothetical protein
MKSDFENLLISEIHLFPLDFCIPFPHSVSDDRASVVSRGVQCTDNSVHVHMDATGESVVRERLRSK